MRRCMILLILLTAFTGAAFAQDTDPETTTITISPLVLQAGESLIYDIGINCLADGCSAFDIAISYNPALIQIDELEVGPYLGEEVFIVENAIDAETGTLRLAAAALGDLPETEDPVLLRVHLTALDSGITIFNVDHLDIGDLVGNPVSVAVVAGDAVSAELATPTAPAECRVSAEDADTVQVRVGPGLNRTSVTYLPAETEFVVQGQTEDSGGTVWYQLDKEEAAPGKLIAEAWVSSEDVLTSAGCDSVAEVSAPPIIPITSGGQGRPTPSSGGSGPLPDIQHLVATSPGCQIIETYNPNPFELGVSWETSNRQSDYFRATPGGTNRFRAAHDPHAEQSSIRVTLVVSTATGDWVHTIVLSTKVC